jgi:hypothetical protein
MKTVNLEELRKKIDELGGYDAKLAYAAGWDDAISEVISVLDDVAYDSCALYKVGSQIEVNLDGFGVFTTTAQKITEDHVVFMFDDCIASMSMNVANTNEGGYQKSGLCYWINTVLRKAFPEEIRQHLTDISIPTYGQIFGHNEFYHEYFETDKDEQFELMKKGKNRIADYENKPELFWLQNATKKEISATIFATVDGNGYDSFGYAADSFGVRPVFTLSV